MWLQSVSHALEDCTIKFECINFRFLLSAKERPFLWCKVDERQHCMILPVMRRVCLLTLYLFVHFARVSFGCSIAIADFNDEDVFNISICDPAERLARAATTFYEDMST